MEIFLRSLPKVWISKKIPIKAFLLAAISIIILAANFGNIFIRWRLYQSMAWISFGKVKVIFCQGVLGNIE